MRGELTNDDEDGERNLGPQPVARLLEELKLSHHDVVAASAEQLTHKMVSRASKGRRLTRNVQMKVLRALNAASGQQFSLPDLFTYTGHF
jgi:hypothetical protein